jgi:hypothetical protein
VGSTHYNGAKRLHVRRSAKIEMTTERTEGPTCADPHCDGACGLRRAAIGRCCGCSAAMTGIYTSLRFCRECSGDTEAVIRAAIDHMLDNVTASIDALRAFPASTPAQRDTIRRAARSLDQAADTLEQLEREVTT